MPSSPTIGQLLKRLDDWLRVNAPDRYATLLPGLSEADLDAAEQYFAQTFPDDFRSLYKWKNGQMEGSRGVLAPKEWLSMDAVMRTWRMLKSLKDERAFDDGIGIEYSQVDDWWSESWLSFLDDRCGSYDCLDLRGSFHGNKGQVIRYFHDDETRVIVHSGIRKWLETICVVLERLGNDFRIDDMDESAEIAFAVDHGYPIYVGYADNQLEIYRHPLALPPDEDGAT